MAVVLTYLAGLALAHVAWFYFFVTGHLLRRRAPEQSWSLADLVITSTSGMAVVGFGLLLLGFARFLNPYGLSLLVLCEATLFWWWRGESWLSLDFWKGMLRRMFAAWSAPAVSVYALLVVLALPAVLPPTSGDPATYHLAYAVNWANSGRVHVDRFLRFPYYANNFLLFYSALFILKLGDYCQFLTWLCGMLACLGVLAFVPRSADARRIEPQQFLVPLGLALSPMFIHHLVVAMVDVPISMFLLATVLCAYRSGPPETHERELIATAAFCAGLKLTMIAYLPLFIGSVVFALRGRPARRLILPIFTLVVLSSPWYVRNLLATGDPITPLLNLHFHRPDPIFSQADARIYTGDTLTPHYPAYLLLLPLSFFSHPWAQSFRSIGANVLVVLLYGPVLYLVAQVWRRVRARADATFAYLSVAMVYLTIPWLVSSLGRYALYWYPSLAAWVAVLLTSCYRWARQTYSSPKARRIGAIGVTIVGAVLLCPSPTNRWFYYLRNNFIVRLSDLSMRGREGYLARRVPAYRESHAVIETLRTNGQSDKRVLTIGHTTPQFYFRRARITNVGDYYGPARWTDLRNEVENGDCRPYLNRLRVAAVIVDTRFPLIRAGGWYTQFEQQLKPAGFAEYRFGRSRVPVFLKENLTPADGLKPSKRRRPRAQPVPPVQPTPL